MSARSRRDALRRVALAGALVGIVLPGSIGLATLIPGGKTSKNDCFIELDVAGVTASGSGASCTDGDACDGDGQCPNKSCRLHIRACVNQSNVTGCQGGAITSSRALVKVGGTKTALEVPASGCGAYADVTVPSKGKKKPKAGGVAVLKVKEGKQKDADKVPLTCVPVSGTCRAATTTTVSASTTTTTIGGPCACGTSDPTMLLFTTSVGSGNCGTAQKADGSTFKGLACGGLYFGGGSNGVPLPATIPDYGASIFKVAACSSTAVTVAATANGELGSTGRSCTKAGCLYGAPLPIPNATSVALSTCVINSISTDAAGSANCSTGAVNLDVPLNSEIFLTGDLLAAEPGIQPCPLCKNNLCEGGPNDGMACTPGTVLASGEAFPTSHDCPPPPAKDIGGLPIGYALSTGTVTRTAVIGLGAGAQTRVFCGYCHDVDDTGNFQQPAAKCLENGAPVGTACTQPFEACDQRSNGAFGPGGGGVTTLTETGSPAGDLTDHAPHATTLVSVFCIPPTFTPAVDGSADLPGPGAAALHGTVSLQ